MVYDKKIAISFAYNTRIMKKMLPKEYADELLQTMIIAVDSESESLMGPDDGPEMEKIARRCAITAIDEILKTCPISPSLMDEQKIENKIIAAAEFYREAKRLLDLGF